MKITNKSFWLSVYGFSIVVSFLVVAVLGSEIYYRDRYYREVAKNDDVTDAVSIVKSINIKYEKNILDNRNYYAKFCETLNYTPKTKDACEQLFSKKINIKPLVDESDERTLKIFQNRNTESEKYEEYIKAHELGYGLDWTHKLGTPYMFILMFALIGLGASTLGSLLIHSSEFSKEQDIERITALLLGLITAMVAALFLVYVFVPVENADVIFSKRLLNVPVSVYVFSFLFSVSPSTSISNFADFSRKQISMLAGKKDS